MKKLLKKKGFTLIELMVVVVIISILAAVAIPKFVYAAHKAKASEFPTILTQIYTAQSSFDADAGVYATTMIACGVELGNTANTSRWFSYSIATPGGSAAADTYTGNATVRVGFGKANIDDAAHINDSGRKWGDDNLTQYARHFY